ncbi:hypothetical protein HMPREF0083_02555, partial [Aneurinibacillus aneurinilyticus ATCC 12856]
HSGAYWIINTLVVSYPFILLLYVCLLIKNILCYSYKKGGV